MFYFLRLPYVPICLAAICGFVVSCSSGWSEEDERFVKTYTEILRIREQTPDTAVANPKVREVVESNGYTWDSFRNTYSSYTGEAEKFRAMLDSARSRALRTDTTGSAQ